MLNFSEIPDNVDLNNLPDDTEIRLDEHFPRYLLDPFEIISPEDPRYKTALTREEAMRTAN